MDNSFKDSLETLFQHTTTNSIIILELWQILVKFDIFLQSNNPTSRYIIQEKNQCLGR